MYKLVSGDKNNRKLSNAKGIENKYIEDVKKSADINLIERTIFQENISDLEFTYVVTALSFGSELKPSIEYNICRVLFFAACVNYHIKDKTNRIKNIRAAMELYQEYDNNYIAVINPPIDENKYISIKWDRGMSLNSYLEFLIPITYFKSKQTGWVTISKRLPVGLKINDNDFFPIPTSFLPDLFEKVNGQVAARSPEEFVGNFLHEEEEKIAEILVFLGFKTILELTEDLLDQGNRFYFYQHEKLMFRFIDPSVNQDHDLESYWTEQTNNCFVLYPGLDYVLWGDFDEGKSKVLVYNQ